MNQSFKTVDVLRRGYGRRYTGLPVDRLEETGFMIDCTESYMRPEMFDLQIGDVVRWMCNGRVLEGSVVAVEHRGDQLDVMLQHVELLPLDFFMYG